MNYSLGVDGLYYSRDGRWWWDGQGWRAVAIVRRTNHILHIILCIITFGMWLPVYGLVAYYHSVQNVESWQRTYGNR